MTTKQSPAPEPAIIVIFGITGDLSKRKLLPALYQLFKNDLLDEHTVILGVTRRSITAEELLGDVELCINEIDGLCDPQALAKLHSRLKMLQLDISKSEEYKDLLSELDTIEDKEGVCMNRLYYLSIPPQVTASIVNFLGEHGLNQSCSHGVASTRLLIEKPFGYDIKSAEELIETISKQFSEDQIFRIDHYLAKETVQNIITFRFYNVFEEIWSAEHVSHIIITASETIGIEDRATFYEQVGALRDIIQSHLLQLLAVTTLDLPKELNSKSLHEAKLALLKDIKPVQQDRVSELSVRGQYKTYKQEVNNPDSNVETYAAIRLEIASKRWEGVPIFLRTGKALASKDTEVRVVFKSTESSSPANILVFNLQPHEGIELDLQVKKPGFDQQMQTTPMSFSYQRTFKDNGHPDAYERVLVDAVKGDHTLFSTSQEVMAAWRVVEPVLVRWSKNGDGLSIYENGSKGPKEADKLIEYTGINWTGEQS